MKEIALQNIASIDAAVRSSSLAALSDAQLSDAHEAVLCARDPAHLGDEPHLRRDVDACGLDDDRLVAVEAAVWGERERRADLRRNPLPLAA